MLCFVLGLVGFEFFGGEGVLFVWVCCCLHLKQFHRDRASKNWAEDLATQQAQLSHSLDVRALCKQVQAQVR